MADTPDSVLPKAVNAKPATKRKSEPRPGRLPPDKPKPVKAKVEKPELVPPQYVPTTLSDWRAEYAAVHANMAARGFKGRPWQVWGTGRDRDRPHRRGWADVLAGPPDDLEDSTTDNHPQASIKAACAA
jgi:hypothetical protein